jgi:hypothetical protein
MGVFELLLIAILGIVILVVLGRFVRVVRPSIDKQYFAARWTELLARVKTTDGMVLAVIDADKLLDEALKKHRFKGKTIGERLVSAQRTLSDNDAIWYAHKLRNRLVHEPNVRLKKSEAQRALAGFRSGLQDLGAL